MAEFISVFANVLVPVFALVALGYFAGDKLGLEARTLSRLAYYVLAPVFTFTILSTTHVQVDLAARMIAFITAVYIGSAVIALALALVLRKPPSMTAAWVMIAVFGNVGNFGLPISQFAQGRDALGPATV